MKSKIFSSEYVKTSSRGQTWIPVLLGLGFLLAFPVAGLIQLGNWTAMEYTHAQIGRLYENLWRDGYLSTGFVVVCIAAIINGINGFWYLYSARKIDFYHSLPIKRSGMFLHKVYVGVLYLLIPYVIMEFLAICIGAMRGYFNLRLMGMALSMLAIHLLLYFLMYFSTVLVISVTGNILMGGLCLFGFFFYNSFLGWLLASYREIFYVTNCPSKPYGLLKFIQNCASAFMLGETLIGSRAEGDYLWLLVFVVIVTVALGILSYQAYVRRPAEKVNKPMIYKWVAVLVKFLVVVPFGLGVGLIFYLVPTGSSKGAWWIFGLILGTVVSHGMMEVIYHMDFRKFFSAKLQFAVAAALVILCTVWYGRDLLGYDAYLPAQEKIAMLHLNMDVCSEFSAPSYVTAGKDGTYRTDLSWDADECSVLGENGMGDSVYSVLRSIVEGQKKYYHSGNLFSLRNLMNQLSESDHGARSIPMRIVTDSGREIYRSYMITNSQMGELLSALYEEGSLKEKYYSSLEIEPEYLTGVSGIFADGSGYVLFQEDDGARRELLQAYREDVEDASAEELTAQPCAAMHFTYEIPEEQELYQMVPGEKEREFRSGYMHVFPTFKRTIAILRETGYPLSMEEVSISAVHVYYREPGEEYKEEKITYEEPEQIEELKKCMVAGSLRAASIVYNADADVMYAVEGQQGESYGQLLEENLPDFVKELLE